MDGESLQPKIWEKFPPNHLEANCASQARCNQADSVAEVERALNRNRDFIHVPGSSVEHHNPGYLLYIGH